MTADDGQRPATQETPRAYGKRDLPVGPEASRRDLAADAMSTDFLAVSDAITVGDAIEAIRASPRAEGRPTYVYVVDATGRLRGVLFLRDLVFGTSQQRLAELMRASVISVPATMDQEEVARLFRRHHLAALPVVTASGHLIGTITPEAVSRIIEEEATEDLLKVAGIAGGEERATMAPRGAIRRRLPWLVLNMFLDVIAVSVIAFFESTIAEVVALAVLLPIISDMGGNVGIQTISLAVRGLATGDVTAADAWRQLRKELLVGLANGLVLGVLLCAVSYVWKGSLLLGIIGGAALAINTVIAGTAGIALPLILKRFGADPASASGPLLTTITDFCGFLLTLSLATFFLPALR